ncbi:MAG: mechanosensitive ion channel domain-containing protein [Caulobacterales bacterium]
MTSEEFHTLWLRYGEKLIDGGLNIIAAAVILVIGLWIAAWAGRAVRRISSRHPRFDDTLAAFFSWLVRYGITIIVIIAVLRRFGVETTSVVALFGAAALAVGLALQGTLSNVAAGVMLILFRPYRLGDSVELNGKAGSVSDVNLFVTELMGADHSKITLPNSLCWGAPIFNFTAFANRRVDVDFAVLPNFPAKIALEIAEGALASEKRLEKTPAPAAVIKSIDHDKTILTAQGWASAAEHGAVKAALLKAIRQGLDDAHEKASDAEPS